MSLCTRDANIVPVGGGEGGYVAISNVRLSSGHLNSSAKWDQKSSAMAGDSWTSVLTMEAM